MGKQYWQFKAIQILSKTLPRRAFYWLGNRLADSFSMRDARARSAVASNINRVLAFKGRQPSDAELRRMTRQVFRELGRSFIDFFHFTRLSPASVRTLFTFVGLEHAERAFRLGKGVLGVSGHYGCFETGACAMIALGYPLSLVARPWEDPRAERLFEAQRARRGVTVIPAGSAARGSLDALRRGDILAVLGDFDFSLRDDRTRFLDGEVRLPLGPARLSAKTGAPIVPFFVTRRPDEGYLMRFHPPLLPGPGMSADQIHERLARVLEEAVLEHPQFWLLFSDAWDCELSLEIARKGFAVLSPQRTTGGSSAG